ncbi:hypothetical protein [Gryllotalpicola sp.]
MLGFPLAHPVIGLLIAGSIPQLRWVTLRPRRRIRAPHTQS